MMLSPSAQSLKEFFFKMLVLNSKVFETLDFFFHLLSLGIVNITSIFYKKKKKNLLLRLLSILTERISDSFQAS